MGILDIHIQKDSVVRRILWHKLNRYFLMQHFDENLNLDP